MRRRIANLVGPRIVYFRQQRKWTQKELIAHLDIQQSPITFSILANLESRRTPATDEYLFYLARAFNVGIHELFPVMPKTREVCHPLPEPARTGRTRKKRKRKDR